MNKLGLNIHGDAANLDRNKLTAFVDQLQAPWQLVMNDLSYAKGIVARRPETKVAYRWTPADNTPLTSYDSAQTFVDFALREFSGVPLYAVVSNEAGDDDKLINRTCEVIEYGCPKGLHVAILGFASGTPANLDTWKRPAMRRLLELCDKWREFVVVALDEYFCGVVTSGFIGGEPKFIQPEEWPRNLTDVAQWHCGRFNFLLTACDEMAIRAPRILIKEHGADDMDDIAIWADKLLLTPPYQNIRSWKSLWNQWRVWWPRWDNQRAYFEQLKYANEVIYANPAVEGVLIFAWNSPDANWKDFDISQADDLQRYLVEYARQQPAEEQPVNQPILGEYNRVTVPSDIHHVNLRAAPDPNALDLGDVVSGDVVFCYPGGRQTANGYVWVHVDHWRGSDKRNTGYMAVLPGVLWEKANKPEAAPPPDFDQKLIGVIQALIVYHDSQIKLHQEQINLLITLGASLNGNVTMTSDVRRKEQAA